jgi:hypothetical protein
MPRNNTRNKAKDMAAVIVSYYSSEKLYYTVEIAVLPHFAQKNPVNIIPTTTPLHNAT